LFIPQNNNEKKYRVELDREGCIGITTCANVDPENWVMAKDNKVDLKNSSQDPKTKFFIREIDEIELKRWIEAAEVCPVNVIHIIDIETGEKLI